jgi:hypothetical protein
MKQQIIKNTEFISNHYQNSFNTDLPTEFFSEQKIDKNCIFYGDRFFYYPKEITNRNLYYKVRRNIRFNIVTNFTINLEKVSRSFSYIACNEISLSIPSTAESLKDMRRRYNCIETELSDSLAIREAMFKEKEMAENELAVKKEVIIVLNLAIIS